MHAPIEHTEGDRGRWAGIFGTMGEDEGGQMIELEFLGTSADGGSVVFTDPEGERYCVAISDELRAAVRRDQTAPETRPLNRGQLRPAEIQALLRQGMTPEEIAERYGVAPASISRYESPVLAEKAWAISQAKQCAVGPDLTVEELVINRLATRGVDHESLTWSALRHPGDDWEISVTFIQSAVLRVATWRLSADGNRVDAIDQEAHWLTESVSPTEPVRALFGVQPSEPEPVREDQQLEAEVLVDQLNQRRGRRQPILDPVELEEEPTSSLPYFSTRVSTPESEEEAETLFTPPPPPTAPAAPKKKKQRRSVPSWDEIVFGARPD
ncbi:septation protein SepH [Scrofimicrobium sp. R131]|uniref:Septation protein SepH n=1 Tax=Scrofimicrobium appendicitidis TaxID=3079930 RepID=A0AAU7VA33_9ACTO